MYDILPLSRAEEILGMLHRTRSIQAINAGWRNRCNPRSGQRGSLWYEMALVPRISNQAETVYQRGIWSRKQRSLLEEWSKHCYNQ